MSDDKKQQVKEMTEKIEALPENAWNVVQAMAAGVEIGINIGKEQKGEEKE